VAPGALQHTRLEPLPSSFFYHLSIRFFYLTYPYSIEMTCGCLHCIALHTRMSSNDTHDDPASLLSSVLCSRKMEALESKSSCLLWAFAASILFFTKNYQKH
jgi:hypothetical protein